MRGGVPETLRGEEVGFQKSCINVDHIAQDRWGPGGCGLACFLPGDLQMYLRERLEELCDYYKEMSWAAGVKKPHENQKAKAFLEYEGSQ